ncbi:type II toxin-antitoxin system YafQ family toxin [Fusobacterium sp.]|uniref:type II toxin-antitoxin system YafQ family toxin n=1 Tax=unclassified Fusobacterium TaxID=2648384 RepID=UPI0025C31E8A|nr:type II toxin-antitoxin system YafQ family toxin [Fusobacterium sp.]
MLEITTTKVFEKDYKLLKKRGYNLNLLKEVIELIANEKELPSKYRNHQLVGNYSGFMECHIRPDWLLIYKIEKSKLILTLSRTGTHSDLF